MDKKQLRVALTVLEAVKNNFPETKKFIERLMDEEFQKEKISRDEVIVLTCLEKELDKKNIFCFAKMTFMEYFYKP